jgi:hypothetical protein
LSRKRKVKGEEFDKARDKAHDKAYEIQRSGGLNPFRTGSNYGNSYRDPNRDRDRNRRESKEFDPDSDSDFDFDCKDVP